MGADLLGITWDHVRGRDPLVACAADFGHLHGVDVHFVARSLQGFADAPLAELAADHDLVVFDHPHLGEVVGTGCLVPLDDLLDPALVADMAEHAVGASFDSYCWDGHLWGAPVDSAGTVAAWRPDRVERPPRTWDEVRDLVSELAHSNRWMAIPLVPIDVLTCFYTLCITAGHDLFTTPDRVVERDAATTAMERLAELVGQAHPMSLTSNPIAVLDAMARDDEVAYCPLLFGYNNYARPGFRPHRVAFGDFPTFGGPAAGGVLGGAGLGISSSCTRPELAAQFVAHAVSPEVQATRWFTAGGQPGDRRAWLDEQVNAAASGFFSATLECMDGQYLRPRHAGYLRVQEEGGAALHAALTGELGVFEALDRLDATHRASGSNSARASADDTSTS